MKYMGGKPPIFFIKKGTIKMFNKLFKKNDDNQSNVSPKIECKVYSVKSGIYLGKLELTYEEYKYRVTFDRYNRYIKTEKEE